MKSFALVAVFAQLAIFQCYGQLSRVGPYLPFNPVVPSPCGCGGPLLPPVIAAPPSIIAAPPSIIAAPPSVIASPSSLVLQPSNSVANSLADTLSLLTVSNLLAESLPFGYPNVIGYPSYSPCGCGNCGSCGYNYII